MPQNIGMQTSQQSFMPSSSSLAASTTPSVSKSASKIAPIKAQVAQYSTNVMFGNECGLARKTDDELKEMVKNYTSSDYENMVKEMDTYTRIEKVYLLTFIYLVPRNSK